MLIAFFCSTIFHWKVINVQILELQINVHSIILLMLNLYTVPFFTLLVTCIPVGGIELEIYLVYSMRKPLKFLVFLREHA